MRKEQVIASLLDEYSIWNILIGIHTKRKENVRPQAKPDLKAIGLRIRGLRGALQQEVLASQLGVSQGQLSKVESGKVAPTLEMLLGMATRFGKKLDWIVKGEVD